MKLIMKKGKLVMRFEDNETKETRSIGVVLLSYINNLSKKERKEFLESIRNQVIRIDIIEEDEEDASE